MNHKIFLTFILADIISMNSGKSNSPSPLSSISFIISCTSWLEGFKPQDFMIMLSSFLVILPIHKKLDRTSISIIEKCWLIERHILSYKWNKSYHPYAYTIDMRHIPDLVLSNIRNASFSSPIWSSVKSSAIIIVTFRLPIYSYIMLNVISFQ